MNYLAFYFLVIALVMLLYLKRQKRIAKVHKAVLQDAVQTGLLEPSSLHPVVDPTKCMGSGACVMACPEKALGVVNGKMALINPAHCIGHGACLTAAG